MTQETRPIFTSQKYFKFRVSDQERIADSSSTSTKSTPPSRSFDGVGKTRVGGLSTQGDAVKNTQRPSLNVPLQVQSSATKDRSRAPSFRKPDRPLNITLPPTLAPTHAFKHPRTDENRTRTVALSSEPPLKKARLKLQP
jgi:hypothetical protein